ncbi:helix-turn-helix domain-containing protein [Clostridium botulinum]|uniref:helix-turn-helix domain-containing protein n=1 Tax=Clostridium botulinum TaxID=1491 RepID=UPI001400B7C8|nr:helix-turn-helix transcriptional regulator [Clostridium botulinum]MBY6916002.1 helix-turn-helix transcriptional regulator [Clostridium botulinum]NFQ40183.1 helix-turn-helix transcriptional regulator [Clostridium botulinum]
MSNILGERIKERRLLLGYNQPELAKIMNVSKQTVSNWESGNRTPDAETLSKLSDLFSVSVDFLLGKVNTADIKNEYIIKNKAKEILEVLKKAGVNLENIDYDKLEQLLKLANIEKEK